MLEHLIALLSRNIISYIGVFIALFLTGIGLPIPEDIILLASGYVTAEGYAHLKIMIPLSMIAILGSDTIMYLLGRHFGERVFRWKPVSYIFPLKRLEKIHRFYDHYGKRAIFIARFTPGLRAWVYIFAGSAKMKLDIFVLMDFLAAVISVPVFIWLGFHFNSKINGIAELIKEWKEWIIVFVAVCILILFVRHCLKRKRIEEITDIPKKC